MLLIAYSVGNDKILTRSCRYVHTFHLPCLFSICIYSFSIKIYKTSTLGNPTIKKLLFGMLSSIGMNFRFRLHYWSKERHNTFNPCLNELDPSRSYIRPSLSQEIRWWVVVVVFLFALRCLEHAQIFIWILSTTPGTFDPYTEERNVV